MKNIFQSLDVTRYFIIHKYNFCLKYFVLEYCVYHGFRICLIAIIRILIKYKADSRLAPSQWETLLWSNTVSHWLGANLESSLKKLTVYMFLVETNEEPIGNFIELDDLDKFKPQIYNHHFKSHMILYEVYYYCMYPLQHILVIFKLIFLYEHRLILIKISLKFVSKGPFNDKPALVQIMAWSRTGDKPLSELMVA